MPRLNKIIDLLERGQIVFGTGTVPNGRYGEFAEIADSEYDFTILEMEHTGFDFPTLSHSLQYLLNRKRIAQAANLQPSVVPLVRVPPNAGEMNQWILKQTLDSGAYGIVMPHVTTVQEARAVVAAMRYPRPGTDASEEAGVAVKGVRGWSPRPAPRYWGLSVGEYFEVADLWPLNPRGELFLLTIVEDKEGVENLPEILREVKGIGAVWAGVGDLSVSLGYPGNTRHPNVEQAAQRILAACLGANVPCCIPADAADVERRISQGFKIILAAPRRSLEALERGRAVAGR